MAQTACSQGLAESGMRVQIPSLLLFAGTPSRGRPGPVKHPGNDDRTPIASGSGSSANSGRRTDASRETLPDRRPIDINRSRWTRDPCHGQCRGRSLTGMGSWKLRASAGTGRCVTRVSHHTSRSSLDDCTTCRIGLSGSQIRMPRSCFTENVLRRMVLDESRSVRILVRVSRSRSPR